VTFYILYTAQAQVVLGDVLLLRPRLVPALRGQGTRGAGRQCLGGADGGTRNPKP